MIAAPRARRRSVVGMPPAVLALIAAAWGLALVVQVTGHGERFHHERLLEGSPPLWAALLLFQGVWQVHVAAMMLPSSLPLVRLFRAAAANQDRPGASMAAFLGGYGAVWGLFGAGALVGDGAVHRAVEALPWLARRTWLIAAAALALAGAFQFSRLKDRCLTECRHPAGFLLQRYGRGASAAFRLGWAHGLSCLGCCWALMLVLFAVGVASLWWMAPLMLVMVYEKVGTRGTRITPVVGAGLLALAALAAAHPAWLGAG
jgi:predicted metal-binding membrane protein